MLSRGSAGEPVAQLTQLNSLAYSINVAHERLRQRVANIDIARTTTGDGYYVWNRHSGVEANINLYHLMHLVLTAFGKAWVSCTAWCCPGSASRPSSAI